jgi:hypothetical protein
LSATFSQTPTVSATPVPVPFSIKVSIYNSAGELVKVLYQGGSSKAPSDLLLSAGVVPPDGEVLITLPGQMDNGSSSLAWDGRNAGGQAVQSGTYIVMVESRDSFGRVESYSASVAVARSASLSELRIYNSAGELVRKFVLAFVPAQGQALRSSQATVPVVDFRLEKGTYALALDEEGKTREAMTFWCIDAQGQEHALAWDGRNEEGLPVVSGHYMVQLLNSRQGSTQVVSTRALVVIAAVAPSMLQQVFVAPNPCSGDELKVYYKTSPGAQAFVKLFNIAGEQVAQGTDPLRQGSVQLGVSLLAPGTYLCTLEMQNGRIVLSRSVFKIARIK